MNIKELLNLIEEKQLTSTQLADANNKTGGVLGVYPIIPGKWVVGEVAHVYTYNGSNWPLHNQIRDIPEDRIVIVKTEECSGLAVFGEIVTKYLFTVKKARAVVLAGKIRDFTEVRNFNYPMWIGGTSPIGCSNKEPIGMPSTKLLNLNSKMNGGIAICDDTGVVVAPISSFNNLDVRINFIYEQEKKWHYNIFDKQMDTFSVICLKKYFD
jgi:4-hydroxy-4-methyl-2-oxoglutarate aldolase